MKKIYELKKLVERYDTFVFDVFGVIHNGKKLEEGILEIFENLTRSSKFIVLLSNAPEPSEFVVKKLESFGLPRSLYSEILTSGDQTCAWLSSMASESPHELGSRCYFIGEPAMDAVLPDEGYCRVDKIDDADFVLACGPRREKHSLSEFKEILQKAMNKKLPMVCGNPDRFVGVDGKPIMRAGSIADHYRDMGGKVFYCGKPFLPTYTRLFERHALISKEKTLVIGDSLHTDIKGASNIHMDTMLLVSTTTMIELNVVKGNGLEAEVQNKINAGRGHLPKPTYISFKLKW